ncbi:uncharacterized protein BDW47DRAFT_102007 [Aspergillus candidus]|uniref:Uncharacterized protein n=1 Tax=Aspergillus candidus TaxID=41067 RepID=A0A2I2FH58_ASPCN|nr:hypothetical protein BDW47DRAFT_102007 [Aspergillus candidus]PLB39963.1 hypothetical protein BDW47DRAFT_102007 [Aspergillus candidus]
MAPFRNFLAKRSAPPSSGESDIYNDGRLSTGAPPTSTSPLSIRKSCENQPPEYKLSVVDDNGAYLPPSPPEKQSIWRRPGSNNSNHRSLVNENEPFSISRESFDSYRRSFDISARSPVSHSDALPSRTSLDSRFSRMSSPSLQHGSAKKPQTMEEEQFEEVELGADDPKPKKRGIFSRFGDFNSDSQSSKSSTFYFPGRKREQSGAGAEMGAIQSPVSGEGS